MNLSSSSSSDIVTSTSINDSTIINEDINKDNNLKETYSAYQTLVKDEYKRKLVEDEEDGDDDDDGGNGDNGNDNDDKDNNDNKGKDSRRYDKRSNHKRKREERGVVYKSSRYDLQLCPHVSASIQCRFNQGSDYNKQQQNDGDDNNNDGNNGSKNKRNKNKIKVEERVKCKYTHDLEAWWKDNVESKIDEVKIGIPALGTMCPSYSSFGWCFAGFRCKFALSHVKRNEETGKLELLYTIPSTNDESSTNEIVEDESTSINQSNTTNLATISSETNQNSGASFPPNPKEINVIKNDFLRKLSRKQYDYSAGIEDSSKNEPKKPLNLKGKIYVAPLTTVGNLPFRRLVRSLGAQVTCGEMALARSLVQGQVSEWAIVRKHECEDIFGVQIAVGYAEDAYHVGRLIQNEVKADFIDVNLGCPIDIITDKGMGSALMERTNRLQQIYTSLSKGAPSIPLAFKMRTGWGSKKIAHNLIANFREWSKSTQGGENQLLYCTVHGRSRQMRYSKTADWDYIKGECLQAAHANNIPLIGNGDIFSFTDWEERMDGIPWTNLQGNNNNDNNEDSPHLTTCLLGRGALIKPWLPTEIRERRHWDISSSERFDILKDFVKYGLEHWGSDEYGVNTTRRFLLEFLSFGWKYVPVGILEHVPQKLHERTEPYYGRNDLETLLASPKSEDWIEISSRLLGRPPESGFSFTPKHKSSG